MPYPQLRCISDYSFRIGASTIQSLIGRASQLSIPSLAITDYANMASVLSFSDYCKSKKIQPIIGCDLKIVCSSNDDVFGHVILLATNNIGYINICKILEQSYTPVIDGEKKFISPDPFVDIKFLCENNDGIIVLSGNSTNGLGLKLNENSKDIIELIYNSFHNRFYVEICRKINHKQENIDTEELLLNLADGNFGYQFPICATTDIQYALKEDASTWEILKSCRLGIASFADNNGNIEGAENYGMHIPSNDEFEELFDDLPDALENTKNIGIRCSFIVEKRNPILPNFKVPDGLTSEEYLLSLSLEGLKARMVGRDSELQEYIDRLNFEIDVINKMGFPGYFLIVSDFIRWAKSQEIPVGPGRGSGAGSVVAWSLNITDVDPIEHGLLFERFLNPERVSMPDFDVDFCTNRRNEVIDYVRNKYGEKCVCMIATFGKIMSKTAIDDVKRSVIVNGHVLGYGEAQLLKSPFSHLKTANMSIQTALDGGDSDIAKEQCLVFNTKLKEMEGTIDDLYPFVKASQRIEGLNRNQSQHAAGVVIGDRPLYELFPVIRDEKNMVTMSSFSGKYVEMSGGVKFDFLGLKNLTIIDETMKIARKLYGNNIVDPRNISKFDGDEYLELYNMVADGKTVGVFQLASPGMAATLKDVAPTCFADIVAIVSLYRPGPMDIIPNYAKRKRGEEEVIYPCEEFTKNILEPTYGFMVYQEQVMQIAMSCAGYTLGGADLLRRAMGKKIREEMEKQRSVFISGCSKNNIPEKESNDLFDTISKFADYGFNKSHAVAYSIIAWQTMYLKLHYPECFYSALSSLSPDSIDRIVYEMKTLKNPIKLLPPDVNKSFVETSPIEKGIIICGMGIIPTMKNTSEIIIAERNKNGLFKTIADFGIRMNNTIPIASYRNLAEVGGLDSLWEDKNKETNRFQLFLLSNWFADSHKKIKEDERQISLFNDIIQETIEANIKYPKTINQIKNYQKFGLIGSKPFDAIPDWDNKEFRAKESLGFWIDNNPLYNNAGKYAQLGCRLINSYMCIMKTVDSSSFNDALIPVVVEDIKNNLFDNFDNKYLLIRMFDGFSTIYIKIYDEADIKRKNIIDEYIDAFKISLKKYEPIIIHVKLSSQENNKASYNIVNYNNKNIKNVFIAKDLIVDVTKDLIIKMSNNSVDSYKEIYNKLMKLKANDSDLYSGTVIIIHDGKRKEIIDNNGKFIKFKISDNDIQNIKEMESVLSISSPIEDNIINEVDIINNNTLTLDYRDVNYKTLL